MAITEDEIVRRCAGCSQCISNARHNLRGGYPKAALSCVEYHERGHREPTPAEALSDDAIRAHRELCREFLSESRLALEEATSSHRREEARDRQLQARSRCAEIIARANGGAK